MSPRRRLVVIWCALLALDVAIQIAMKIAGDELAPVPFGAGWLQNALSSWLVWAALIGYVATFVLWLAILQGSALSAAFPVTALVYVLVPLCSWLFLDEHVTVGQLAGIVLIVSGVVLQQEPRTGTQDR